MALSVLLLGLAVASCQQLGIGGSTSAKSSDPGASGSSPTFAQFSDLPIPGGSKIDLDKTLVLGSEDAWIGRLVLDTGHSVTELYDFYKREMPRFGWNEVTTVRASVSVLVYQAGNRVATVKLQSSSLSLSSGLNGGLVDITVSPRGSQS